MRILLYGRLAELVEGDLDLRVSQGQTVNDLRDMLAAAYPELGTALRSSRVRACVGDSFVAEDYVIAPGDQIEFFPPVSGG